MISNKRVLRAALVAGALVLTACSDDSVASHMDSMQTGTAPSSAAAPEEGASFNEADVAFAQGMVPHHEQAIEMARMAAGRAEDPRVLDLAGRIESAQAPEIQILRTWLADWDVEDSSTGGMDHGDMDHGGGMMSEDAMTALMGATGAGFDRMFLEMMVEHHTGAVEMAETEAAEGKNTAALSMAESIVDTQNAEVAEMEQLLGELDG